MEFVEWIFRIKCYSSIHYG